MKNKVLIVLTIVFIIIILNAKSENNLVVAAYNASGAKLITCNINSYAILKDKSKLSIEEILNIQKEICINLGLNDYDINDQQNNINDITTQSLINISDELGRIFNIKVECYKVDEKNYTNYVYVDAILDSNIDYLNDTYKTVNNCYRIFRIKPIINTCVVGTFNGELDDNTLCSIKDKINNATKVKLVEDTRYLNSHSITAYNSNLSNYILSNGEKINFNYALRYNMLENTTYIYIASPVINIEY